jgi:hypothetical protein
MKIAQSLCLQYLAKFLQILYTRQDVRFADISGTSEGILESKMSEREGNSIKGNT